MGVLGGGEAGVGAKLVGGELEAFFESGGEGSFSEGAIHCIGVLLWADMRMQDCSKAGKSGKSGGRVSVYWRLSPLCAHYAHPNMRIMPEMVFECVLARISLVAVARLIGCWRYELKSGSRHECRDGKQECLRHSYLATRAATRFELRKC